MNLLFDLITVKETATTRTNQPYHDAQPASADDKRLKYICLKLMSKSRSS